MDDSLRLIQHLYGEHVDDPTFARRVAEDEALRAEYEALQDTKAVLDRRPSSSPDPDVVDDVVGRARDAAASAPAESTAAEPAPDRAARSPDRGASRRLRGVSAVLAILVVMGVGWWQFRTPDAAPAGTTASTPPTTSPAPAEAAPQSARSGSIPEWDDRDEVVRLHRRIETLRTRSQPDGWGGSLQTVGQAGP
jgi:hypothetical protein